MEYESEGFEYSPTMRYRTIKPYRMRVKILNEEKLIEINDYYHDELEKALSVMWDILDAEMKHNIKLPKHLIKQAEDFTNNFKFRYLE